MSAVAVGHTGQGGGEGQGCGVGHIAEEKVGQDGHSASGQGGGKGQTVGAAICVTGQLGQSGHVNVGGCSREHFLEDLVSSKYKIMAAIAKNVTLMGNCSPILGFHLMKILYQRQYRTLKMLF